MIWLVLAMAFVGVCWAVAASRRTSLPEHNDESDHTAVITLSRESQSGRTKRLTGQPDSSWVSPQTASTVGNITIPGGMVYIGSDLPAANDEYTPDPALVDPTLPVDLSNLDPAGNQIHYWPSYSALSPGQRATYLKWLSGGRRDPAIGTSYLFVFFYGLERRLLIDANKSDVAKRDVPALIAELKELAATYADRRSFNGYVSHLVGIARVRSGSRPLYEQPPPAASEGTRDLGFDLAVALGQLVRDGKPITADWAYVWFIRHPDKKLRTAVGRCPNEFETLFKMYFTKKFPTGWLLKPNKRKLTHHYHPGSAGLRGVKIDISLDDIPDLQALSGPINTLQEIADDCVQQLDAYSRYLGKNPDGGNALERLALLPADLSGVVQGDELIDLHDWLVENIGDAQQTTIESDALFTLFPHENEDRFLKREATTLAQTLSKIGFGLEPDVRFGGSAPTRNTRSVLFKLGDAQVDAASTEYKVATVLLHLATTVAGADGGATAAEKQHLEHHLEEAMQIDDAEARRLRAHLQWLLAEQPGLAGLKKRLDGIDSQTCQKIARFAVTVAGADGRITPDEIKILRKQYSVLGLDPESVYADIHSLTSAPASAPVTVMVGKPTKGFAIPPPPNNAPRIRSTSPDGSFELDMKRVQQKLRETEEVTNLLSEILMFWKELPTTSCSAFPVGCLNDVVQF